MNVLKIVAIKDTAVQAFMRPVFVPHAGGAIREFADAVNNAEHDFSKHPEDYELYELGEFLDDSGRLDQIEVRLLARAKDLLRKVV